MKTFHDDGNWKWEYECQFFSPISTDPKDWYYQITLRTYFDGHLSSVKTTCRYWQNSNFLRIHHENGANIEFHAESFKDAAAIINPMIKAYGYVTDDYYKSNKKLRREKLNKINE